MTPQQNDVNKSRRREPSQKFGLVPFVLAAVVIVAGTLLYVSLEDPTRTSGGAPVVAPTSSK